MTRWTKHTVDMLDHHILNVGPYDRRSAWMWLVQHAAWKDKRVNHKGSPITLQRGQVLAGRAFLAAKWKWSEQNVRTFMKALADDGMIEKSNQSNGHFANVITICNYEKYQSTNDEHQPENQPVPNQCLTSVQPVPNQTLRIDRKDITTTSINTDSLAVARKTRGSRLPDDWVLPKSWGTWARTNFPQSTDSRVREEADKFRDFWRSKAGKDARKADWEATWRNWVRKAFEARNDYPKRPMPNAVTTNVVHFTEAQKDRDFEQWARQQNLIPGSA